MYYIPALFSAQTHADVVMHFKYDGLKFRNETCEIRYQIW